MTGQHDLAEYADYLRRRRDEHIALYAEFGTPEDRGYANGFRVALAFLYIHTKGEFGEPSDARAAVTR